MDEQGLETAFDAAEQKVREYPNCGKLIHMMASMVQGLLMMSGGWSTDRENFPAERIRYGFAFHGKEVLIGCE